MTEQHTSKSAQSYPSNQEAHLLLTRLIDRVGLNRRGFLDRLADLGFACSDDDFKNWSRAGRAFPRDWQALRAMIQVVTQEQPAQRRCTAAEALRFLSLVGMPFAELQPIAELFSPDEFSTALSAYLPRNIARAAHISAPQQIVPAPPTSLMAQHRFAESLAVFHEIGGKKGIGESLTGLASVAAIQRLPVRAVQLWGAVEALYEETGGHLDPADQAAYEHMVAMV
jgi:hypothetical protein